ncbi:MAG: hypothetical protein ACR2RB_17435 [Gammaproteobacteria bacterium]
MIKIKSDRVARDKFRSMKLITPNPIQQVLEAEREAKERIERAQRDAEAAVGDTRRTAKQLLKRNERRTQQALARYEKKQKQLTEVEAEGLRQEAAAELKHAQTKVDKNLKLLVDETFDAFWPK